MRKRDRVRRAVFKVVSLVCDTGKKCSRRVRQSFPDRRDAVPPGQAEPQARRTHPPAVVEKRIGEVEKRLEQIVQEFERDAEAYYMLLRAEAVDAATALDADLRRQNPRYLEVHAAPVLALSTTFDELAVDYDLLDHVIRQDYDVASPGELSDLLRDRARKRAVELVDELVAKKAR